MDQLRRTLAKYEEQAEAHREAAELAQKVGSEAAYTHQVELQRWYEQEAEQLRQQIAERIGPKQKPASTTRPLKDIITKPGG